MAADDGTRVLNYGMDLDQEHALTLGADLLALGGSMSGDSGRSEAGRGAVFEEEQLRAQLRHYENERLHFTMRLRQLLEMKERGFTVDTEVEEVARALASLANLVDQTTRALRGYGTENDER